MKLMTPKGWLLVLFSSSLWVVAMIYVQHNRVPGKVENIVRAISAISGLALVPILLFLAYLTWKRLFRQELPSWRNGLGLCSIILLSSTWLFSATLDLFERVRPSVMTFFNLEWFATVLYTTITAAFLALALRGAPRVYLVAAGLLMWAYLQSEIYF